MDAPAKQAIGLVQKKVDTCVLAARTRIGEDSTRKRLTPLDQSEADLHGWPTIPKRPLYERH
jgi:hypothetical protein